MMELLLSCADVMKSGIVIDEKRVCFNLEQMCKWPC